MATKVTVNSGAATRISINSRQRTEIRTVGVSPPEIRTLSQLTDVDTSDADDNETLVYDEASGKFVIKTLPVITGGTF